jgi:hypothetical protein
LAKHLYISLLALSSLSAFAQKNTNNLEFVENKGQWNKQVTFMGELGNGAIFLQKNGFTMVPTVMPQVVQRHQKTQIKILPFTHMPMRWCLKAQVKR